MKVHFLSSQVRVGTGVLFSIAVALVCAPGAAQAPVSGAEAVREIDWTAVSIGSPIPELMPAAESDDPMEAGFVGQWVERAISDTNDMYKPTMEIISKHRGPEDHWAEAMDQELRQIVTSKIRKPMNTRVFCNSVGCLCYVERHEEYVLDSIVYRELLGEKGRKLGIKATDLYSYIHIHSPGTPWELTTVRRPSRD